MKRCVVVLIVALLTLNLVGIVQAGGGHWERQNSPPTGASLFGVWGSDANDVFAVGGGRTLPHHDGNVWTTIRGDPNLELEGMWGHVSGDIFTVSRNGALGTPATAPFTVGTGIAPHTLIPNTATTSSPEVPEAAGSVSALDDDCQAKVGDTVYNIVQKAIDDAEEGDTVLVSGYCSGTEIRGGLPQVAYIDKTLTLQGGWNSDFDDWDPATYTTTLDALGDGRVVYITGDIEATVEGFEITGGDADGLGGSDEGDAGGGIYVITATAVISGNTIHDNSAEVGGGIYVDGATTEISGNTIYQNSARDGGGIFVNTATTEISGNTIHDNSADVVGGGVCLAWDESLLSTNMIVSNSAGNGGGGIVLLASSATLEKNTISGNSAEDDGYGGGLLSLDSSPNINGNTFSQNTVTSKGGGLGFVGGDHANIQANTIISNSAQYGGGISLNYSNDNVMINNVIAGNESEYGGGVEVCCSSVGFVHTTLADNHASETGGGVYVNDHEESPSSTVWLTNTIIANHEVGVYAEANTTINMSATLWDGNTTDQDGPGTINRDADYDGAPRFIDPDAGDYDIGPGSAAIDRGIDAGVATDILGRPRPDGPGFDLGAYEFQAPSVDKIVSDVTPSPGQLITYTITIYNNLTTDISGAIVSDTMPSGLTFVGPVTLLPEDAGQVGTPPVLVSNLTIDSDQTVTVAFPARVNADVLNNTTITNTVSVTSPVTAQRDSVSILVSTCRAKIAGSSNVHSIVQEAIDDAEEGDTVLVSGYCSGTVERGGLFQVAYIDKALTLQGGWSRDFTVWDPATYTTTLDALDQGRVVYITGDIEATVESFEITGGDAEGLGGADYLDGGGGIYVITATAVISGNTIYDNSAEAGGGIHLRSSSSTLERNLISNNSSDYGGGVYSGRRTSHEGSVSMSGNTISENNSRLNGGGIYSVNSDATISNNTISQNVSGQYGGGLGLAGVNLTLRDNTISGNSAADRGGGIYLDECIGTLEGNTVSTNRADSRDDGGGGVYAVWNSTIIRNNDVVWNTSSGSGGGFYLYYSYDDVVRENRILSNTASEDGGGLYLYYSQGTSVESNHLTGNSAEGSGGGVYLYGSWGEDKDARFESNHLTGNSAGDSGGGAYVAFNQAVFTNTLVADNVVGSQGGGFYIYESAPRLWHTTIARNTGSGIYATGESDPGWNVRMYNTIVADHDVGIQVEDPTVASMWNTLWWGNNENTSGSGLVNSDDDFYGDPAFVDADSGDYHLGSTSAAIDKGLDKGVTRDLDGNPRPHGAGPDIGAYEYQGDAVFELRFPLILKDSRIVDSDSSSTW